jgi:hypothetical protein
MALMNAAVEQARLTRNTTRPLADDIRASLREALDHAAGKRTGAVVHNVNPRATDARDARLKLGLSQRESPPSSGPASARCANGSLAHASRRARRAP